MCAFAAHMVIQEGYQAAVMVPTEIIASQHCAAFQGLLSPGGVRVGLLVGGQAKKEREQILCGIREGELDLIVGTHALIQEGVDFRNLALVVVDEQHKFGVVQRALLRQKGIHPDVLFMTATPIPRTLALTLYGDLNSSVLDEMPPGRKPVKTFWRPFSKEKEVYQFIRDQVGKGCQVYIVCPLVEESDKIQVASAIEESSRLAEEVFPDLRVALLHGRMKSSEKEAIMRGFRNKEYDLLISTTVIEVGVDIQNATVMVILHADRFGLAQLHQLRGRVGRGSDQSYCVLLATPGSR
ncbi:MAG: DEAD/DEAH box helicase, partial [Armatimonadetes bacterium]|nr:DEAD/DEAH box helicase [Armatimonadota bacterium]